jgi:hypothetical protein
MCCSLSQIVQVEVHAHAATAAASGRVVVLSRVALPLFASILPEQQLRRVGKGHGFRQWCISGQGKGADLSPNNSSGASTTLSAGNDAMQSTPGKGASQQGRFCVRFSSALAAEEKFQRGMSSA